MKKITLAIISISLICICCERGEPQHTRVEGYVYTEDSIPISGVQVQLYGTISKFLSGSYRIELNTISDWDGSYLFDTEEIPDNVTAIKEGYFDTEVEQRFVEFDRYNRRDIYLNQGCKVNFDLENPRRHPKICMKLPFSSECQHPYYYNCFLDTTSVNTSCYFVSGDSATICYYYYDYNVDSIYTKSEEKFFKIYLAKGGELNIQLNFDY